MRMCCFSITLLIEHSSWNLDFRHCRRYIPVAHGGRGIILNGQDLNAESILHEYPE